MRNWWMRTSVVFLLCAATAAVSPAQTFTTLHNFDGTHGYSPRAELIQGTSGFLYGTTYEGGTHNLGTVFEITTSGTLTTLHSFCSQPSCADGEEPQAGLVQATNGNFYGTTSAGGANGGGTVFEINPSGKLTTLYSFCSQAGCTDGEQSIAALVQGGNGDFYGTTYEGGTNNDGTVFKITPSGVLTTLYSFCSQPGCLDGEEPSAALVEGTNGNFYGTTYNGGTGSGTGGGAGGTIFEITPSGALTTVYSFCTQFDCSDGDFSSASLIQATNGDFYGTTQFGGTGLGGSVFMITPGGTLTTVFPFDGDQGLGPQAALVQATDGNFYAPTYFGGNRISCGGGCGTLFQLTTGGTLTNLYNFCADSGCPDGRIPDASLIQATNGLLYGTTAFGGADHAGTIFTLDMGLGPFVETLPTSAIIGANVKILGTSLTGATSVTFNGVAASFTVVSSSLIKTTVPTGATTGSVEVTTPSGTLTSNIVFRMRP